MKNVTNENCKKSGNNKIMVRYLQHKTEETEYRLQLAIHGKEADSSTLLAYVP
jgi:hypothetical protein